MDTNDDKYQNYQLNTTNDEKNYETKYSINPAKQSPSSAAQIEMSLFASISTVPIVATKDPVFPSAKVPAILWSIFTSSKPSPIAAVTVVSTRAPVDIVKRRPIEKVKSLF